MHKFYDASITDRIKVVKIEFIKNAEFDMDNIHV